MIYSNITHSVHCPVVCPPKEQNKIPTILPLDILSHEIFQRNMSLNFIGGLLQHSDSAKRLTLISTQVSDPCQTLPDPSSMIRRAGSEAACEAVQTNPNSVNTPFKT